MRLNQHGNFKVQRFQLFEQIEKTTVPLVIPCPTFPIRSFVSRNGNTSVKKVPCFENLQIACGENYHNIPGYGSQRSAVFATVAITWGIFFVV